LASFVIFGLGCGTAVGFIIGEATFSSSFKFNVTSCLTFLTGIFTFSSSSFEK